MNTATQAKPIPKKRAKTGGRKKGSLNRVTRDTRELLKEILTGELKNIDDTLKQVEPKDRLQFIIKILPYTIPQYANIDLTSGHPSHKPSSFISLLRQQGL